MAVEIVRADNLVKTFTIRKQKSIKDAIVDAARRKTQTERFQALNDVSFTLDAGQSLGLVGPNGSGKSTLLKIVGGILAPTSGRIMTRGRIAALLELGTGFHPDLSGRENVFLNASLLGLSKTETLAHFDDIVEFSGIPDFIDTQVKFYSSGMYVRLAFAVAVHVNPDILLVDEVLAVGDEPFQAKCMDKIREFREEGRSIIFVSHSARQVLEVCDRAIVLQNGKIVEDDTPMVALGRLRQAYQGQIEADRDAEDPAPEGNTVRIRHVHLTSIPDTNPYNQFQVVGNPGLTLQVHCDVEFQHPEPGWSLSVGIETSLGEGRVLTDSEECLQQELPAKAGRTSLVVTFPDLKVGVGDYVVNVIVRDRFGERLASLPRAAQFAMRRAEKSRGPVYSEASIEVVEPG